METAKVEWKKKKKNYIKSYKNYNNERIKNIAKIIIITLAVIFKNSPQALIIAEVVSLNKLIRSFINRVVSGISNSFNVFNNSFPCFAAKKNRIFENLIYTIYIYLYSDKQK